MIEKTSNLDLIFRKLLLSKFFTRGWGSPSTIKRQFDFLRVLADRSQCEKLVDGNYPVKVDSDVQKGDVRILDGHFRSPLDVYLPNVMPKEVRTARFQLVVPKKWPTQRKPVCIHMAGTGDHFFWRRRTFLARPLIKEYGIGSLLIENPFYGCRKPKSQLRSSLQHVNELFVMGGGLILEGLVMLHWCEKQGFGPLGLTGISMGGHMASLTATNWHKPIPLIPCLSWSSATPVFTEGVMSGAIPWPVLVTQYLGQHLEYEKEILRKLHKCPKTDAFRLGQEFAWNYPESVNSLRQMHPKEDKGVPQDAENCSVPSESMSRSPAAKMSPSSPSVSSSGSAAAASSSQSSPPSSSPSTASASASASFMCNDQDRMTSSGESVRSTMPDECSHNRKMSSSQKDGRQEQAESCNNLGNNLDMASSAIEYGGFSKMSLYETVARSSRDRFWKMGRASFRFSSKTETSTKDVRDTLPPNDAQSTSHGSSTSSSNMQDSLCDTHRESMANKFEATTTEVFRDTSNMSSRRVDSSSYKDAKISSMEDERNKKRSKTKIFTSSSKNLVKGIENYQEMKSEALEFMRGAMDVTTFVGNFSTPVDPSLIIVVTALRDAYVPRKGVPGLDEIWPNVEVRYIDCGHITAFLFKQTEFRKAINDAFNKYSEKYEGVYDHQESREDPETKGKS